MFMKKPQEQYVIRWQNKMSGEAGYVAKVCASKGYFEAGFDQTEAKKYKSGKSAGTDLQKIMDFDGEAERNEFEICEIPG